MWDERYSEPGFAFGTAPNDFLAAQVHRFPEGGRVICLAEGEGRNAVFLARRGFEVLAVDQSPVGLDKARALAREQGVTLETRVADLNRFSLEPDSWDAIVSIYAHVPPETRKRLHAESIHALRPGGICLLEAYTRRQLDMPGVGGPPPHMAQLFMDAEALREELDGLHLLHLSELEREVNEGAYHTGLGAVVQVIGQKG
ncbi:MAG: class I SAM-dependent methyltransferase [Gammaproteobacteria bacterium]